MHILFLTQVLPYPLDAGAKVREYFMLRYLAARHDVTLVCFGRASDGTEALAYLRTLCRDVKVIPMHRSRAREAASAGRSLLTSQPYTILRDDYRSMRQALAEIAECQSFDAVHADQLSMAQYALSMESDLVRAHRGRPKMVLDAHNAYYLIPRRLSDVETNPALRIFLRREAHLMARYEARVYQRFDHVLTVTEQDLTAIRQLARFDGRRPSFTTVPICVDASTPPLDRLPEAPGLLMLGGLHWPPNADAARWLTREIWPRVQVQVPHARLFIVGARPPDDIRALGDFNGISQPEQAGDAPVVVTGYVKDPRPFLRASAVLAVALRSGGGMRVKIVEAMQWGLPVVTTTIGCEGIYVTHDQNVLIADDPSAFAQALVKVLLERATAKKLSEGGRRLVAQYFDWRKQYASLDGIYQSN